MTTNETLIKVEGLKKSFGELDVLKGIDNEIKRGEVVCIIGPSGSGKSTFLRCLNLLEVPTGGKIIFDGEDITDPKTDINRHRMKMGMVFQQFNLFPHMTVLANMTIAPIKLLKVPKEEAEARALKLLERVGLADRWDAYPSQLSGGQKQRVAIAGIIAMEPECLVLDEPTAMLDPKGRKEIVDTLLKLNREKNITVILITHYMEEAEKADRVILMNDGVLLDDGTPKEIFKNVENMKSIGLDVPQTTELLYELQKSGFKVDTTEISIKDTAKKIAAALNSEDN